jgi:nitrite reductase/ring-hydroxylating ferredoxin subunit/uncharacterized membrane protein
MRGNDLIKAIERQDFLDQAGDTIQPVIANLFKTAGQDVKNFLHGIWLGHPIHPALSDVPLGSWSTALVFDLMQSISGRKELSRCANIAISVGLVGALGTAMTGLADWSATSGRARKIGLIHGLLNTGATCLYGMSLLFRSRRRSGPTGIGLSLLGYTAATVAAYLGGHLVYDEKIGVNHATRDLPKEFVPVCADTDLHEGEMKGVDANGIPVLLVRRHGAIHALANICSHLGGPLSEGTLDEDSVRCPWHGSRFSVCNGNVVDGPAVFPQPCLATRVRNGQIQVRAAHS